MIELPIHQDVDEAQIRYLARHVSDAHIALEEPPARRGAGGRRIRITPQTVAIFTVREGPCHNRPRRLNPGMTSSVASMMNEWQAVSLTTATSTRSAGWTSCWTRITKPSATFTAKRFWTSAAATEPGHCSMRSAGRPSMRSTSRPRVYRNLVTTAENAGLADRIHASVMPAETLAYPDGMFDLVLGVSILHHTDVSLVEQEIQRVLKPGGRAIFIEPLAHNPFLRLFRLLTPNRRTPTEEPMTVDQIKRLVARFRQGRFRGFHLLSIMPPGLLWATGSRALFRGTMRVTQTLDRWLLAVAPPLRRYCWMTLIDVTK